MSVTNFSTSDITSMEMDSSGNPVQRVVMTAAMSGSIVKNSMDSVEVIVDDGTNQQRCVAVVDVNGGGSVDYNRTIEKASTIPAITDVSVGKVYMYSGATSADYTHGYIYEAIATKTATAVEFSDLNITWDISGFIEFLKEGGSTWNEVTNGTMVYDSTSNLWIVSGLDSFGRLVMKFQEYTEDLESFGCVFSVPPEEGDSSTFTLTTTDSGKKWKRVDIQPGIDLDGLPTGDGIYGLKYTVSGGTGTFSWVREEA